MGNNNSGGTTKPVTVSKVEVTEKTNTKAKNDSSYDYLFKLLLVGDSGVGKSSVLLRIADNVFTDSFISTIGVDFKIRSIEVEGRVYKFQIWDTAGQERFRTITSSYYRGAHLIFVCYDITDPESFNNVAKWVQEVSRYTNFGKSNIMIIGCKNDLIDEAKVSYKTVLDYMLEDGLMQCCKNGFITSSAKSTENTELILPLVATFLRDECDEGSGLGLFELIPEMTEDMKIYYKDEIRKLEFLELQDQFDSKINEIERRMTNPKEIALIPKLKKARDKLVSTKSKLDVNTISLEDIHFLSSKVFFIDSLSDSAIDSVKVPQARKLEKPKPNWSHERKKLTGIPKKKEKGKEKEIVVGDKKANESTNEVNNKEGVKVDDMKNEKEKTVVKEERTVVKEEKGKEDKVVKKVEKGKEEKGKEEKGREEKGKEEKEKGKKPKIFDSSNWRKSKDKKPSALSKSGKIDLKDSSKDIKNNNDSNASIEAKKEQSTTTDSHVTTSSTSTNQPIASRVSQRQLSDSDRITTTKESSGQDEAIMSSSILSESTNTNSRGGLARGRMIKNLSSFVDLQSIVAYKTTYDNSYLIETWDNIMKELFDLTDELKYESYCQQRESSYGENEELSIRKQEKKDKKNKKISKDLPKVEATTTPESTTAPTLISTPILNESGNSNSFTSNYEVSSIDYGSYGNYMITGSDYGDTSNYIAYQDNTIENEKKPNGKSDDSSSYDSAGQYLEGDEDDDSYSSDDDSNEDDHEVRFKSNKMANNVGELEYYWSDQFQSISLQPDSLNKFERLYTLAQDFVDYAVIYSKIIISELGLTYNEKTLKPIAIGGIAGGSKWYYSYWDP